MVTISSFIALVLLASSAATTPLPTDGTGRELASRATGAICNPKIAGTKFQCVISFSGSSSRVRSYSPPSALLGSSSLVPSLSFSQSQSMKFSIYNSPYINEIYLTSTLVAYKTASSSNACASGSTSLCVPQCSHPIPFKLSNGSSALKRSTHRPTPSTRTLRAAIRARRSPSRPSDALECCLGLSSHAERSPHRTAANPGGYCVESPSYGAPLGGNQCSGYVAQKVRPEAVTCDGSGARP